MEKTEFVSTSGIEISIGLAVYNEQNNIEKALKSILSQTHKDFELIISDDCSKDNTYEICKKFSNQDSRIRVFKQKKNIGVAENFNFVFKKSKHKYFIWLAGDDTISIDYLEESLKTLIQNKNCVFSSPPHCFKGDELKEERHFSFSIQGELHQRGEYFLKNSLNATGCNFAIFKREVLETVPDMEKKFLGHDWKVLSHALSQGDYVRSKKGLLVLGRGGLSSAPDFMAKEVRKTIEHFIPLYEFSKFFFKCYVTNKNIMFNKRILLLYLLFKLNLRFIFLKYVNILRSIIKGNKNHPKLGDAYKKL